MLGDFPGGDSELPLHRGWVGSLVRQVDPTCMSQLYAGEIAHGLSSRWVLFFFLTCLLEHNYFTLLCQFLLYNKVNQLYVYLYPHIPSLLRLLPTLPIPSLQVVTKQQAALPVLYSCFPLVIDFTFGSIYMSMPLSHFIPAYPSPAHILKSILYVCIFIPVLPLGSS